MNEWHYFEVERLSGDSEPTHAQLRMALLSIADGLRRVWFKERLNAGPDWASIYGEFKGKVSGEHLEHLRHLVEEGGDALYMGPVKGYKAEAAKQLSTEEEGVVLKEFAKLLFAKKAIVFDYSDPLIEKRLVASGVRMGSTVVAEKKTAAGIPTGEFRVCNDSTDKEHAYAANSGINSQAHSHQKTTNPAGVVTVSCDRRTAGAQGCSSEGGQGRHSGSISSNSSAAGSHRLLCFTLAGSYVGFCEFSSGVWLQS